MPFLKKKENQLVILILFSVVLYLFSPDFFWQISLTPYIKPEVISKIPEGLERAIKSHDFYDLRYLQYISIYFAYITFRIAGNTYRSTIIHKRLN